MSNGAWETIVTNNITGLARVMITGEGYGVQPITSSSFTPQGSTAGLSYSGGYSAEWIVEDPTNVTTQSLDPLANFGSVTFTDLRASLSSWTLSPDEECGIVQNGVTLATPTPATADGFTDTYTGP
jgi:hypothetical protein